MPVHVSDVTGWGFMCDVMLCLPLYIFVRIIKCPVTPELIAWLQHPIKRFMLIKLIPPGLRSLLLEVSQLLDFSPLNLLKGVTQSRSVNGVVSYTMDTR